MWLWGHHPSLLQCWPCPAAPQAPVEPALVPSPATTPPLPSSLPSPLPSSLSLPLPAWLLPQTGTKDPFPIQPGSRSSVRVWVWRAFLVREVSPIHSCRLGTVCGQEGRPCGLGHVGGVEDRCCGQMWGAEYEDQVGVGLRWERNLRGSLIDSLKEAPLHGCLCSWGQ